MNSGLASQKGIEFVEYLSSFADAKLQTFSLFVVVRLGFHSSQPLLQQRKSIPLLFGGLFLKYFAFPHLNETEKRVVSEGL